MPILGVYFAENLFRISAAEGCRNNPKSIFSIKIEENDNRFWRTKLSIVIL